MNRVDRIKHRGGIWIPQLNRLYPSWEQTYSSEDFDRAQQLASELTEADRRRGRAAPAYGYSGPNFKKAETIVRASNRYFGGFAKRRTSHRAGAR